MLEKSVILNDVAVDVIKLNPDNPRINEPAVARVEKSIRNVGYISPIIVDENMMILAGNTRYKALVKMGLKTIPDVKQVFGLTEQEKKRYILEDNKTHEFALWDYEKMAVYDEEFLKDIGFSDIELDKIKNIASATDDDIPPVKPDPIAQRGDVFQLGQHRIMCGDSLDEHDILKLMGRRVFCPKCGKEHIV